MGQHLLLAYLKSLQAVMHVQFTRKGLRGGRSGVVKLAEESQIVQVQPCHGLGGMHMRAWPGPTAVSMALPKPWLPTDSAGRLWGLGSAVAALGAEQA